MSYANLENITVSYGKNNIILKDLNLEVKEGELLSLLGPSGCGKSTTLRTIAGFLTPDAGTFTIAGENYTDRPVHKRDFGIVFQSYALFPHLSIFDNVAFGLKIKKLPKEEITTRVEEMIAICGLTGFEERFPKALSGGQRQRVALARALVTKPKLLLLDEPLSNLDAKLRIQMRTEIRRIQKELNITTIFVTHDQEECFSISDRVAIMHDGVIEQCDTPEEIYAHPKTEYVAQFIGFTNFFPLEIVGENLEIPSYGAIAKVVGSDGKATATIRPEYIQVKQGTTATDKQLLGTIEVVTFLGQGYQYNIHTAAGTIVAKVEQAEKLAIGDTVLCEFNEEHIVLV